jgi:hypothetical protein
MKAAVGVKKSKVGSVVVMAVACPEMILVWVLCKAVRLGNVVTQLGRQSNRHARPISTAILPAARLVLSHATMSFGTTT